MYRSDIKPVAVGYTLLRALALSDSEQPEMTFRFYGGKRWQRRGGGGGEAVKTAGNAAVASGHPSATSMDDRVGGRGANISVEKMRAANGGGSRGGMKVLPLGGGVGGGDRRGRLLIRYRAAIVGGIGTDYYRVIITDIALLAIGIRRGGGGGGVETVVVAEETISAPGSCPSDAVVVTAAEEEKREYKILVVVVESKAVEEEEEAPVVAEVGNRFVDVPAVPVDEVNRCPSKRMEGTGSRKP